MNWVQGIVVAALFFDYFMNMAADYLNLRSLQQNVPELFKGIYDDEKYAQSQKYLLANTRFGMLSATVSLLVLLGFWFAKGFPLLDAWARSWNGGPVVTGLIYFGALFLFKGALSLPFTIYHTFVIEERFGFNKTTPKTFLLDLSKGLILSVTLGAILFTTLIWFLEYTGKNGWWYCWITLTLFMLIFQYVVPTWIMPLFNRFTPLEEGELKRAIMDYAKKIQFSLDQVFVMDGSKRSTKSNAFFSGFGKNKRIVLFDTLIEKHSTDELVSVLAHEMGHYKKKHILKMMIISILYSGLILFLASLFLSYEPLFRAFFMERPSVHGGLIFFGLLYSPIDFLTGVLLNAFSRKNEYEADRFAVTTSGLSHALVSALKKLSIDNLSNLTPHPLYVYLHYSHPPVIKRIVTIEKTTLHPA